MASLETSIIATSLVPISANFEDGQKSNWIVAAYLITYTSLSPFPNPLQSGNTMRCNTYT